MYQSLYRKYRPKTFDDVVGQKVIVKILKSEITQNKLNHAYLFTGPRGTGKTSVAKILAKTINCENIKEHIACDKCVFCTQINEGQSIDIIEIDAASNNGVDEIRELKSKVTLVPSTGKYKVYIIDEVHMLTVGAFNALLKTLEEPPAHIIFILATTEPHKIPETILSRCQKFDFKKMDDKSMQDRLNLICELEKIRIEQEAINEIIRFSQGGMRDAISLLEQASVFSDSTITLSDVHEINGTLPQHQMKELVNSIINKKLIQTFELLEKYDADGKNLIKLAEEIIIFLKNGLILKNAPNYTGKNISREIYVDLISKYSSNEILDMIYLINNTLMEMKTFHNTKLVFELLMITLIGNNIEDTHKKTNNKNLEDISHNNYEAKEIKEKNTIEAEKINNQSKTVNEVSKEETANVKNINGKDDLIPQIKEIRVNNTLVKPSRKILNDIKVNIDSFRKYLLDSEYGQIASLILDATIPAANETNIVFVYQSNSMVNIFNNSLLKIEKLIEKVLLDNYKVVAISEEEWQLHRSNYKNKTKSYNYIKESEEIEKFLLKQNSSKEKRDEIHTLFGDIIEYNK